MTRRLPAHLPYRLGNEGDVFSELVLPQVLHPPASAQAQQLRLAVALVKLERNQLLDSLLILCQLK